MGIECGIRIKESLISGFEKGDVTGFTDMQKQQIRELMHESCCRQYQIARVSQQTVTTKSFSSPDRAISSKGVELYCEWKGIGSPAITLSDSQEAAEVEKGVGVVARAIASTVASRVSCGVRFKDFVLDMDESTFKVYLDDALNSFVAGLDNFVLDSILPAAKTFDAEYAKDVEVYCEIKKIGAGD